MLDEEVHYLCLWIIGSLTITIGPLHVHIIQKSERNTLFSKISWVDMVGHSMHAGTAEMDQG